MNAWTSGPNLSPDKWAHCGACGWFGLNSDLTQDGSAACGASDDCPECGVHGCMTCCYDTEEEAERGERNERVAVTGSQEAK